MKTKLFLLLSIILITFLFSCTSTKKVAEAPKALTPNPIQNKIERKVWMQSYLPSFKIGDKINFYVGAEVVLEGDFFNSEILLDGVFHQTNNVLEVMKKVEVEIPGTVIDLKKVGNNILEMIVSFSKEDATYLLNFKLMADKGYHLNGNVVLIFEEKKYPVLATIKGDECKLYFDIEVNTNVEKLEGKAEGNPAIGTQIISKP